jgi:hypothetical protein
VAVQTVAPRQVVGELRSLLDSPEIASLIAELEDARETGRKGYGSRALIGACLVKSLYAIPTWSRTAALIAEHAALRDALGDAPSVYACYRFATKLRANRPALDACLTALAASLRVESPDYGQDVAIDASDLPAHGNGQRFVSKHGPERKRFSDPDASWGHRSAVSTRRGGGFYGFKLNLAVCTRTGLPLAWEIETARANESTKVVSLLDRLAARGFAPETCAMDRGYDVGRVYDECAERGVLPIIPLRKVRTNTPPGPPTREHGAWTFGGADFKRGASKWRCPTGECKPASRWIKASRRDTLIPRDSKRFRDLYFGRAAVEREFGRLKNEYGLNPLRVRGLAKVALHADLVMLARLSLALASARAVPLAA